MRSHPISNMPSRYAGPQLSPAGLLPLSPPAPLVRCLSPPDGVRRVWDIFRKEQCVCKSARNLTSLACIFPSDIPAALLESQAFCRAELNAFVPQKGHCTKSLKLTGIQPAEGVSSHCHSPRCPRPNKPLLGQKPMCRTGSITAMVTQGASAISSKR